MPSTRSLKLSVVPTLLQLYWRRTTERGMHTFPVVERLDVVEQTGYCNDPRALAGAYTRSFFKPLSKLLVVAFSEQLPL